jgi:hypothetical protein
MESRQITKLTPGFIVISFHSLALPSTERVKRDMELSKSESVHSSMNSPSASDAKVGSAITSETQIVPDVAVASESMAQAKLNNGASAHRKRFEKEIPKSARSRKEMPHIIDSKVGQAKALSCGNHHTAMKKA